MTSYRVNNNKPDVFVVEMYITATDSWLGVANFPTLDTAIVDIRKRLAADTFVPKMYDSNGNLLA